MAIVKLTNQKERFVTADAGAVMWAVLNGEVEPTEEQALFLSGVKQIYLNWRNAPDSYIDARKDIIFPIAIGDYLFDYRGKPVRPQPKDVFGREFGKKWGLVQHGFISDLGLQYWGGEVIPRLKGL